jgi:hypothetical protein
LTNAKFDLEKYNKDIYDEHNIEEESSDSWLVVTPMIHFCREGDLKMCRYLFVNGADCRKGSDNGFWFPMHAAATQRYLYVCKWLYDHGARDDIRRANNYDECTPLYESVYIPTCFSSGTSTSQWLILNGALCQNDSDTIEDTLMRRYLNPNDRASNSVDKRPQLLLWAQETVQLHSTFLLCMLRQLADLLSAFIEDTIWKEKKRVVVKRELLITDMQY